MTRSFQPFPLLQTPRLQLRRLDPADAPHFFALRSDPRVNAYLDRPALATVADAEKRIGELRAYEERNQSITWVLELKGEEKLIGTICLWNADDERNALELGFELMPGWSGKGLMQEAATAVIDYAFNKIKAGEVQGWTHRDNLPSQRLMERQGFVRNSELEASMAAQEAEQHLMIYTLLRK